MKKKELGSVYTPNHIVQQMLDFSGYKTIDILEKNIIDTSCGDGAFLVEIVKRYITISELQNRSMMQIKSDLENYIHGFEIDSEAFKKCLIRLDNVARAHNINNVKWDIKSRNALEEYSFENMMDFVVGNPPYVISKNNINKKQYANYAFCKKGNKDLYLAFYEHGLKLLKENGILCFITPDSWFSSKSGKEMRNYLLKNLYLKSIITMKGYDPFSGVNVNPCIVLMQKEVYNKVNIYSYSEFKINFLMSDAINQFNAFNGFCFNYIDSEADYKKIELFNNILSCKCNEPKAIVKNGIVSMADKVYTVDCETKDTIPMLHSYTGQWRYMIYPYDGNGNLLNFDELSEETQKHLERNREILAKRNTDNKYWYAYGRSQGIKDVSKNKIGLNTIVKDKQSLKLIECPKETGIIAGLYIITDHPFKEIKKLLPQYSIARKPGILNSESAEMLGHKKAEFEILCHHK